MLPEDAMISEHSAKRLFAVQFTEEEWADLSGNSRFHEAFSAGDLALANVIASEILKPTDV